MNLNFNEICRLCLRFCEEYIDLNQTNGVKTLADDVVEKIKYCYVIKVDLSEGFPTKVCYDCIRVLSCFYTAKKNVILSEQLLRDILFVRTRVQQDARSHDEEKVSSPDITEIRQEEQHVKQTVVAPKNNDLNKPEENNTRLTNVKLNCLRKYVNSEEIIPSPVLDMEKDIRMCENGETLPLDNNESRVKKKKKLGQLQQSIGSLESVKNDKDCHLKDTFSVQNSNLDSIVKLKRDSQKERHHSGKTPKSVKTDKNVLGTDSPLKENVVREIGTVIDINNILSPNVKRTRKSILAS